MSDNNVLQYKLEHFIKNTLFLKLGNNQAASENCQVIFWDADAMNLDQPILQRHLDHGCVLLVISSLLSKELVYRYFNEQQLSQIGILGNNMTHHDFVEEITRLSYNLNAE